MAKAIGPDFVALQVRDLDASRKFYEENVGLEVDPQGPPNAVVFRTEPIPFAVREPSVDLDAVEMLGWGISLWFRCDDAQELHESLVAAGFRIVQEPFDGPFGRTFSFTDPDGYAVTVHDG
jgi:predicted enzyme related to lactoylglutathione lyase